MLGEYIYIHTYINTHKYNIYTVYIHKYITWSTLGSGLRMVDFIEEIHC